MSKSVVFVSIFDLTCVYYEMAAALAARGHRVSWITTNELWSEWLRSKGVADKDILQLVYERSDFVGLDERTRLVSEIRAAEKMVDVTVNQSLLMDRFVLYKNKPDINEYMLLYYRDTKRYLREKQADIVFAEPTNSNEMITYMLCHELGIPFIAPDDMRYPAYRTIFCPGFNQATLAVADGCPEPDLQVGRNVIDDFGKKQEPPLYFEKLTKQKVIDARTASRALGNRVRLLNPARRRHLTYHDLSERLQTEALRLINGFYMKRLCRYDRLDGIAGRIAFYPLHVQPEASIDVRGSFFSDQIKLIKDIRRSLPIDVTLVVKEHPNFLGQRGAGFFRKLRRIPNVTLVPHGLSTFDIYKRASIVFTVTGTAAYEAGLLGIPAVVFSPIYFAGLSSIRHCRDITDLKRVVFELLDDFRRDLDADTRFMATLMAHSHEGYWTNPLFDPAVMVDGNIERLQQAFVRIVESAWVGKKMHDVKSANQH